jgi:hypothetical protein
MHFAIEQEQNDSINLLDITIKKTETASHSTFIEIPMPQTAPHPRTLATPLAPSVTHNTQL